MSCKVGSARSSYGNTSPGDQSGGKEVSTQEWYLHPKGWVMLRPVTDREAEDICECMLAACANNKIGYDQNTRNTLYNAAKVYSFDVSKVGKAVNTDCSALVRVCCAYAGIDIPQGTTTSNLVDVLVKTGRFIKYTSDKYCKSGDFLKRGDILCTRSKGHVVVVVQDGKNVVRGTVSKKQIAITGESVNVRSGAGKSNNIVRIVRSGMKLGYTDTKIVDGTTWYHIADGWVSGKYAKEI